MPILAVILAAAGLALAWLPRLFWLGIPLSLSGFALGRRLTKTAAAENQSSGLARAAKRLGAVGFSVSLSVWLLTSYLLHSAERRLATVLKEPQLQAKLNDAKISEQFEQTFVRAMTAVSKPSSTGQK